MNMDEGDPIQSKVPRLDDKLSRGEFKSDTLRLLSSIIQYNNLFAFPFEKRLQEIYIYFLFYVKMLSNFEIIYSYIVRRQHGGHVYECSSVYYRLIYWNSV